MLRPVLYSLYTSDDGSYTDTVTTVAYAYDTAILATKSIIAESNNLQDHVETVVTLENKLSLYKPENLAGHMPLKYGALRVNLNKIERFENKVLGDVLFSLWFVRNDEIRNYVAVHLIKE